MSLPRMQLQTVALKQHNDMAYSQSNNISLHHLEKINKGENKTLNKFLICPTVYPKWVFFLNIYFRNIKKKKKKLIKLQLFFLYIVQI